MSKQFIWRKMELPNLDDSRCTGCGDCVDLCPTDCLTMRGPAPILPRPCACISCRLCVEICPADALEMVEITELAEETASS